MTPTKILYVDDEAMALKYFDRLVSPLAPVLTALSVAEGKQVLAQHADEIAVLVSDQRMPGALGNELLRYAREHHPHIVRMLTTAYSELGEAIEAINTGEIYRYITKPWDIETLQVDLRNALELASLRNERDSLVRQKMAVQQQQLLGYRVGQLAVACGGFSQDDSHHALHVFFQTAVAVGCPMPPLDWSQLDHADLVEAETRRALTIGRSLVTWQASFSAHSSPGQALDVLASALGSGATRQAEAVWLSDSHPFIDLLSTPSQQTPSAAQVAWLAWLVRHSRSVQVVAHESGWLINLQATPRADTLRADWLAADVEQLLLP
jgi:two-component system, probable response regulator PhcQ